MSEVDEGTKVGGDVEMSDINVNVPSKTDDVIKDISETQAEPQELSTLDSTEQLTVSRLMILSAASGKRHIRSRDVIGHMTI